MKINFYDTSCQEPDIDDELFGICDDENDAPAYVALHDSSKWIATVDNSKRKSVTFTAIDNCIEIRRANNDMESRCDGMLTYPDNIIFVELKDQMKGGWIPEGLDQLEVTISRFRENHSLDDIRHKRAFVINKRRVYFQHIENELSRRFFDTYKVRISVGGEIKIK